MRLYLSSFRLGNKPEEILALVNGNKVAVIANAADMKAGSDRITAVNYEIEKLAELGLEGEELDLRQYFNKQHELASALQNYNFIWVRGGNVFLLRRAYKQSGFDSLLTELLKTDKIAYGGYSAGVCILSPSLRGVELVDPPEQLSDGYDKEIVWDGLGILSYAIAPHYKSDHPESEAINQVVAYFESNSIAFKTLKDGEAIVVNGSTEKVIS